VTSEENIPSLCPQCGTKFSHGAVQCTQCRTSLVVRKPVSVNAAPWDRARRATLAFIAAYCVLWLLRVAMVHQGAFRYLTGVAVLCGIALTFYRAMGRHDRGALSTWTTLITVLTVLMVVVNVGWFFAMSPTWFPFVLSPIQVVISVFYLRELRAVLREIAESETEKLCAWTCGSCRSSFATNTCDCASFVGDATGKRCCNGITRFGNNLHRALRC
jgi:hypothetical protein